MQLLVGNVVGSARLVWLISAVVVAALLAVGGGISIACSLSFPSDLAQHPVSGTAVVVDSFINGFGGDPVPDHQLQRNSGRMKYYDVLWSF
jgi:hypothetical protein